MNNLLAGGGTGAGITNPILGGQLQTLIASDNGGATFLGVLIPRLITLVLTIGVIYFFFMLLMGGIAWIGSGGDKNAMESAKGKITNALVGIVIMFSVFAIAKLVEIFFGISILTLDIGSLVIQ